MMNDNLYDKIEAYLREELDAETSQAFEADIKSNKELAQQVEMHRFEHDAMEVLLEKDLRQQMAEWGDEDIVPVVAMPSDKPQSGLSVVKGGANNRRWFYTLAAAASVALALVVAWWLDKKPIEKTEPQTVQNDKPIQKVDTPSVKPQTIPPQYAPQKKDTKIAQPAPPAPKGSLIPPAQKGNPVINKDAPSADNAIAALSSEELTKYEKLAERNYREDAPDFETRGGTNTEFETVLTKAIKAYNQKNYTNVVELLKNLPQTDDNFEGQKVLAHAYFNLKEYASASKAFETVLKMSGNNYKTAAQWYLLLSYLGDYKHQATKFKALAAQIVAEGSEYKKDVETLLSDMKTK